MRLATRSTSSSDLNSSTTSQTPPVLLTARACGGRTTQGGKLTRSLSTASLAILGATFSLVAACAAARRTRCHLPRRIRTSMPRATPCILTAQTCRMDMRALTPFSGRGAEVCMCSRACDASSSSSSLPPAAEDVEEDTWQRRSVRRRAQCARNDRCVFVCVCIMYVCIHACMYARMHVRMHACTYVCVCVCVCIHI